MHAPLSSLHAKGHWAFTAFAVAGLSLAAASGVASADATTLPSACSLLSTSDVSAAFGGTVSAKSRDFLPKDSFCDYKTTEASPNRYRLNVLIEDLDAPPKESETANDRIRSGRKLCRELDGTVVSGVGATACVYIDKQHPKHGVQFGAVTKPTKGKHTFSVSLGLKQLDSRGHATKVTFMSAGEARAQLQALGTAVMAKL